MQSVRVGTTLALGYLRQTPVRIVKIMDSIRSEAFSYSAFRTDRLEEWWLTPEDQLAWSSSGVLQTGCRDLNHLATKLTRDEDYRTWLRKAQSVISRATGTPYSMSELHWRVASRLVDDVGPVLSIVCGTKEAIEALATRRATAHASSW